MRRYIFLLLVLCLHGLARGQTGGYNGYYWFDSQQGKPQTSPVVQGSFEVDASALVDGIHTFHYIVIESDTAVSSPIYSYFLKSTGAISSGQLSCLCIVDGSLVHKEVLPTEGGAIHWNLDVNSLDEGLHMLQINALMADGAMSGSYSSYFVKTSNSDSTIKGYYWFDDETNAREASVTNGTFEVDASSLSDGFHRFNYVALQENGVTSMPSTCYFLKTAQVNPDDELTCICSVDGQLRHIEKLSQSGGILHWNLDMQDLADGVHQIQLQAVTPSGAVSNSYNSYFMRVTSTEDLNEMYCVYAIDGNSLNSKSNVISQNGSFHFDLDLSELEEGLHYISFMLHSDRGTSTAPQLRFFVKTPLGGNGITKYQYWINEEDISTATTVALQEKVNPLQLMSLIPIESRPLRSSLFHFDISSGKPMIYARNTIHLRFYDAAQRFSDVAKDYNDYSISKEVKPVGMLQSTQTFDRVAENDILWYTLPSAPGDTVSFKLSQPATIQLFAPSGKEVFNTSGSASVRWSGIHTWEDGTYYLAVHDVTGSQENMTLEYMHMDKYDVVDWDVYTVGNGGCSTITFKGNGFRDLYAVDLVVAPGDTIQSVYISHDSDAETEVAFDFTGATLGEYDVVFHFTEEDKPVANVVTVEEAVDIELATTVTYPSMFLQGTPTTYTIKITNEGNMTAYNVPIVTYIKSNTSNGISHIDYDGLELPTLFSALGINDSLSTSDIKELIELEKEFGALPYFIQANVTNENDSSFVKTGLFFINIEPNTTKELCLRVTSDESIDTWFTLPNKWIALSSISTSNSTRRESISDILDTAEDYYCCYRDMIECYLEVKVAAFDIVSTVLSVLALTNHELVGTPEIVALVADLESCITSIRHDRIKAFGDALCYSTKETIEERLLEAYQINSVYQPSTYLSCVGAVLSGVMVKLKLAVKTIKTIYKVVSAMLNGASVELDAINFSFDNTSCKSIFQKKLNCPPNPGGGGGVSRSVISFDPNDIYGYLSQAGSRFIADSVARVNYTIEFENDTTFATAAAHTIVIKDTLDSNYFDLTKFMPTGIRIGKHEMFLDEADVVTKNNVTSFVKTIDMRPEINAIAQVDGTFSHTTGIAEWRFTSLDPMTMEPTDDFMSGFLPVNHDGTSGIGDVFFNIDLKQPFADGTEIKNRASIVFDGNAPILTPTWTNIVDAVAPSSRIDNSWMANDSTLRVTADASDARSGVWKYEWYVQAGENAPWWKEGETYSNSFDYHIYEGIDYGFCVLVTDSAGNVEQKVIERERGFKTYGPDYEDTIEEVPATTIETGDAYDVSGRKVGRKAKGIIIRNSDGTTRKVLIKE